MTAFEGCSPESLGRSHALARRPLATAVADGWPPAPSGATESGLQADSSPNPALTRPDGASLGSCLVGSPQNQRFLVRSRLAEEHRWHPACGRRGPATGASRCSGSPRPTCDPTGPERPSPKPRSHEQTHEVATQLMEVEPHQARSIETSARQIASHSAIGFTSVAPRRPADAWPRTIAKDVTNVPHAGHHQPGPVSGTPRRGRPELRGTPARWSRTSPTGSRRSSGRGLGSAAGVDPGSVGRHAAVSGRRPRRRDPRRPSPTHH